MPEQRVPVQITVDLAGLREVSDSLRHQTEADLRPGLATAQRRIGWGARFCSALDCAEGRAARNSANHVLAQHRKNVEVQLRITEALNEALDQIAKNYTDADIRAAARIYDVDTELNKAIAKMKEAAEAEHAPLPRGMLP
jgi:flagellar hook-basal body complex protein FliE